MKAKRSVCMKSDVKLIASLRLTSVLYLEIRMSLRRPVTIRAALRAKKKLNLYLSCTDEDNNDLPRDISRK